MANEGVVNAAFSATEVDGVNFSFGSRLIVHKESSTINSARTFAHAAEIFGKSALPLSIGPKDPSQYLTPILSHSQFEIYEAIDTQPRPGNATRSFQINGEDMGTLFNLTMTIIHKDTPRSRILVNVKDRVGDCVAVFRGPEGTQGCVCCCTRCAQTRLKRRRSLAPDSTGTIFLNPLQSLTVESPPGSVVGHITLHHDFYGIYDKGITRLLYSVPFKGDSDVHNLSIVDDNSDPPQQGKIFRENAERSLKIKVKSPHENHTPTHKLLFLATALCMFGMEIDRTPRPLEWMGCIPLRNFIEDSCCAQ